MELGRYCFQPLRGRKIIQQKIFRADGGTLYLAAAPSRTACLWQAYRQFVHTFARPANSALIKIMETLEISVFYQPAPPPLTADFTHLTWQQTVPISLSQNWRGEPAPAELHTTARVLWTAEHLWCGFECGYTELDIDVQFDVRQERHALWERDVCEAFIRSPLEPSPVAYKEFEIAPTGQWFDVAIRQPRLDVQWDWQSGMLTAATIDKGARVWRAVMALPFVAFGAPPNPGDCWHANLYRISRLNGERQFLAFAPTLTEKPDYHVPERFAKLRFNS
jgi:hypothetical protein